MRFHHFILYSQKNDKWSSNNELNSVILGCGTMAPVALPRVAHTHRRMYILRHLLPIASITPYYTFNWFYGCAAIDGVLKYFSRQIYSSFHVWILQHSRSSKRKRENLHSDTGEAGGCYLLDYKLYSYFTVVIVTVGACPVSARLIVPPRLVVYQ